MFPPTLLNRRLQHLPLNQDVCQCRLLDRLCRQHPSTAADCGWQRHAGGCTLRTPVLGIITIGNSSTCGGALCAGVLRIITIRCRSAGGCTLGTRVLGIITIGNSSTCGGAPRRSTEDYYDSMPQLRRLHLAPEYWGLLRLETAAPAAAGSRNAEVIVRCRRPLLHPVFLRHQRRHLPACASRPGTRPSTKSPGTTTE